MKFDIVAQIYLNLNNQYIVYNSSLRDQTMSVLLLYVRYLSKITTNHHQCSYDDELERMMVFTFHVDAPVVCKITSSIGPLTLLACL